MNPARHTFAELTIWRTALPDVQIAILPPQSDRPNPRLNNGLLFVSVFSPGFLHALDAATGRIVWSRKLPPLGGAAVEFAGGLVLASTAQTLQAFDAQTGRRRWEFCPYGKKGDSIYSQPCVTGERILIGDRAGWLYYLRAETGETIWKQLTPGAASNQVNATAIVVNGVAITANNTGFAVAYSIEDGRLAWETKIEGPCIHGLFLFRERVAVSADSLFLLDPASGAITSKIGWRGRTIAFAAPCGSRIAVLRGHVYCKSEPVNLEKELLLVDARGRIKNLAVSGHCAALRHSAATGLLYAAGFTALDIFDPRTGELTNTLTPTSKYDGCGLPEISSKTIYADHERRRPRTAVPVMLTRLPASIGIRPAIRLGSRGETPRHLRTG